MKFLQGEQRKELLEYKGDGKWVQNLLSVPWTRDTYSDFRIEVNDSTIQLSKVSEDDKETVEIIKDETFSELFLGNFKPLLRPNTGEEEILKSFLRAYLYNSWIYPLTKIGGDLVLERDAETLIRDKKGRPLVEHLLVRDRTLKKFRIVNRYIHGFNGSYVVFTHDPNYCKKPDEYFFSFVRFDTAEYPELKGFDFHGGAARVKDLEVDSKNRVVGFQMKSNPAGINPGAIFNYGLILGKNHIFEYDEFDNLVCVRGDNGFCRTNNFYLDDTIHITFVNTNKEAITQLKNTIFIPDPRPAKPFQTTMDITAGVTPNDFEQLASHYVILKNFYSLL